MVSERNNLAEYAVNQINAGVLILSPDWHIEYWNPFMASHSGLSAEAVLDCGLFSVFPELPRDWLEQELLRVRELKTLAFSSWENRPYLFHFKNPNAQPGEAAYMLQNITLFPILDSRGEVAHVCITVYDATDTAASHAQLQEALATLEGKQKEQQELIDKLEQTQNQLLQSEKMAAIGQLAAGVAHEINNPIGFVYSNINTLRDYIGDLLALFDSYEQLEASVTADHPALRSLSELKRGIDIGYLREDLISLVSESQEGIERVKQIVQSLKDFSHIDDNEFAYADLHKGILSTLNVVNNELKYKASVTKEFGEIPEVECLVSQINQVVMNLLVNAAHAIPEFGSITIRTGTERDGVFVEVEDNGTGIKEDCLNRIFDPFFTTKPVGKGTGLGLSLSYSIVQKHHGSIRVHSQLGVGTCFHVWLPVNQPSDVLDETVAPGVQELRGVTAEHGQTRTHGTLLP